MMYANYSVIGKCSLCGGNVVVPTLHWSVVPPIPYCLSCGAQEDKEPNIPVIKMKKPFNPFGGI